MILGRCRFFNSTVLPMVTCALFAAIPLVTWAFPDKETDLGEVGMSPVNKERISAVSLGFGGMNALDEYLSPGVYRGMAFDFSYQTIRRFRQADGWYSPYFFNVVASPMRMGNGNGRTYALMLDFRPSWERLWIQKPKFTLTAGPGLFVRVGGVYNVRNSNNPAQLKLHIAASVSGETVYRLTVSSFPIDLRWRIDIPLLGYNFSPDFGLQYYEMYYLGQMSGASHFAWPGNLLMLAQRISADIPVGGVRLRLGYMGDYWGYNMGGVRCRIFSNTFLIGIVRRVEIKHNGR